MPRIAPDAILAQSNLLGTVVSIVDDPDTPDGLWLSAVDHGLSTDVRVSFPTPAGPPSGVQEIRVLVRRSASGGSTPTAVVELWEAGALRATLVPSTGIMSATGTVLAGTFNAATLTDPTGASVEVRVNGVAPGGKPADRRSIGVGAIEWNATLAAAPLPSVTTTGTAPAVVSTAGSTSTARTTTGRAAAMVRASSSATTTRTTTGTAAATAGASAVTSSTIEAEVHTSTGTAHGTAAAAGTTTTARTITATAPALAGASATHATNRVTNGTAGATSTATATTVKVEADQPVTVTTTGTATVQPVGSGTTTTVRTTGGTAQALAGAYATTTRLLAAASDLPDVHPAHHPQAALAPNTAKAELQ